MFILLQDICYEPFSSWVAGSDAESSQPNTIYLGNFWGHTDFSGLTSFRINNTKILKIDSFAKSYPNWL